MKIVKIAILTGAMASVAALAVAQDATPATPNATPQANRSETDQPKLRGRLARLDANNDGAVDQQEFATAQNLKDADTNGDGELSKDELVTMIQKRQAERAAERMTRRLDIDGDGKVTIAEIEKNRTERFALMDRNDDGKLEGNELRRKGGDRHGRRDGDRHGDHHRKKHQGDDGQTDL